MRIRRRLPAIWCLACLAGLPAVAEAQLFPNLPIHKRTREDCALEKPLFGLYRQQYYGYYPTCWRKFPPGWGCPTPDAPNWAAEVARSPVQHPGDPMNGDEKPRDRQGAGDDPFEGGAMPPLPTQERSPFELDEPAAGGNAAPDPGAAAPRTNQSAPDPLGGAPDPFELPGQGGATPAAPGAGSGNAPPPNESASLAPLPDVAPPAVDGGAVYVPGSDLPPPSLSPSTSAEPRRPVGATTPGAEPSAPSRPATRNASLGRSSGPMISPVMGPAPSMNATDGLPAPGSPISVGGGDLDMGRPIPMGDPGASMGPVTMPGEYVELPESGNGRTGRVRNFFSGLFYGRGLRR